MTQKKFLFFVFLSAIIMSCTTPEAQPTNLSLENIIPKPVSVSAGTDAFVLTDKTQIYVQGESPEQLQIGQYLADKLKPATGFALPVSFAKDAPLTGNIYLSVSGNDAELGNEGYELI